jgi:hypothetical protein
MAYRLSQRLNQNKAVTLRRNYDLFSLSSLLICGALISFFTAWIFTFETSKIYEGRVNTAHYGLNPNDEEGRQVTMLGPIEITKPKQVVGVEIATNLPNNSWAFVEGEVLDADKEYLFSFGDEFWHESGYDDGAWEESYDEYEMKITFTEAGRYYLSIKAQANSNVNEIRVRIGQRLGSGIPHFVLGLVLLACGLAIEEMRAKTISKLIARATDNDES